MFYTIVILNKHVIARRMAMSNNAGNNDMCVCVCVWVCVCVFLSRHIDIMCSC